MTSITDVPLEDIKLFLTKNNVKIPTNNKSIYDTAFSMIITGKGNYYPDSLIDWIIAHNLLNEGKDIRIYTRGEIDLLPPRELKKLSNFLDIYESNNLKRSVINVLKYLKKLDISIVHPDIDINILQLVDEQRILTGSYETIIKIFSKNKSLRKFIYDNMERIIKDVTFEEDYISTSTIEELVDFIVELMKMKEITLAKEALRASESLLTDEDNKIDFVSSLNVRLASSNDEHLLEDYFKLLPYLNNLFPNEPYDDIILELFDDNFEGISSAKEYRDHVVPFLIAAMRAKNKDFVDHVIMIWEADDQESYYDNPEDKWFLDEMNDLIKQAKMMKF
jgi:hypothetical protein